ncbi:MAG: oligosaccharide flippase family protein [Phycisphaerales bacterium]
MAGRPGSPDTPTEVKGVGGLASKGSMSRVVGLGMTWVLLATAVYKSGAFIQQIFLGYLLLEEDFGMWATSAAAAAMFTWLRDAGVRELVIQRGEKEYHRLEGSVFWLAMTINLAAGFVLAVVTPALPTIVHSSSLALAEVFPRLVPPEGVRLPQQWSDPKLHMLMLCWAIWMPTQTFASLLMARLQMLLRFGNSSSITMASSLMRSGLTVLLAYAGLGPISFVIPMILAAIVEAVWAYALLRDKMWARPVDPSTWPSILGSTKWLMLGVLGTNLFEWGGILFAGLRVDETVLGLYAFARQIPMQIFIIMSTNLRLVLFPTMSILKDDTARLRVATLKALRVQMLLTAPMCIGLAVITEPLVSAIWRGGKWDEAALPAAILSVFFAFRVTFGLTTSVLNAAGKFKAWALLTILEGLGLGTAALIGANFEASATSMAIAVGLYFMVSRLLMILFTASVVRLNWKSALLAVLPPWGWALLVGAATYFLAGPITNRTGPELNILILSSIFTVLFVYGTRMLMPIRLNEFVHILPARVQTPLRALLRLPELENGKQ